MAGPGRADATRGFFSRRRPRPALRPPVPRIAATAAALVALAALLPALVLPWGTYVAEAPSGFSQLGCSGDFVEGRYHLDHFSRRLLEANGTPASCPRTASYWQDGALDSSPGIGGLRSALPLAVAAAGVGLVALAMSGSALGGPRRHALVAGSMAAVAAVLVAIAVATFAAGAGADVDDQRSDARGDLHEDPDAFGWAWGFYLAIAAAVLLLVAGVLSFLPVRTAPDPRPGPDRRSIHAADVEADEASHAEARPEPAAEESPAGTPAPDEAADRPPRRLTCPRCQHRFVGQWGVAPTCPRCAFRPGQDDERSGTNR